MKIKIIAILVCILVILVCIIGYLFESNTLNKSIATTNTPKKTSSLDGSILGIFKEFPFLTTRCLGDTIILSTGNGKIVNNSLIVKEHYLNRLNETFTDVITTTGTNPYGNDPYLIKEYYNGALTGTFHISSAGLGMNQLQSNGYYENSNSSERANVHFHGTNPGVYSNYTLLYSYPFFTGNIAGSKVTIMPSLNKEKYYNDSTLFTLTIGPNVTGYTLTFLEKLNGVTTGEYLLNKSSNNSYSGYFVHAPNSSNKKSYPVTLYGSFSPY